MHCLATLFLIRCCLSLIKSQCLWHKTQIHLSCLNPAVAASNCTMPWPWFYGAFGAFLISRLVSSSSCPELYHYSASTGKCYVSFNWNTHICIAHQRCFEYSGRLIEGEDWLNILSNPSSELWTVTGFTEIWIGLSDVYDERGKNGSGWRWFSGRQAPASSIPWMPGKPDSDAYDKDCVVFLRAYNGVGDKNCGKNAKFICEPFFTPVKRRTEFAPVSIDSGVSGIDSRDSCTKRIRKIGLIDCFAECYHSKTRYTTIFYNENLQECRLVYVFDGIRYYDNSWRKFKVL